MRLLLLTSETDVPSAIAGACASRGDELCHAVDLDAAAALHSSNPVEVILVGSCPRSSGQAMRDFLLGAQQHGASIVLLAEDSEVQDCADDFLVRPITERVFGARMTILERRRQSWAVKRATLAAMPDLMFRIDRDGRYVEYHAADPSLLFDADLIGKTVGEVLPPNVAEICMETIHSVVKTGEPAAFEYTLPLHDVPHRFEARLVSCGSDQVIAIVRDITPQYNAVFVKQRFASRVITAQETERQHVSHELHDVVGQMLLVHRMDADYIARHTSASDDVRTAARSLCSSLDDTLHIVRTMALGLRPPALDDLGLGSALTTLVAELTKKSGVRGVCEIASDASTICSETTVALYRIAQEAVSNAIRHANGTRVTLTLGWERGHILLSVQDDGVGISERSVNDVSSLGLLSMRERAELFGGHVTIERATPRGTIVAVEIPDKQHHIEGHRSPELP